MTRTRIAMALTLCFLVFSSYSLNADVRADEKSRFEFAGMIGKVVNLFGGKAAKEGVSSTVAVKGDRRSRISDQSGQIVDLSEEKIYDLDMKKKTYKVTTFEELRRRLEGARQKAREDMRKAQAREKDKKAEPPPDKPQKEFEVDFNVKNTGEKKTINGFDTHEVVMTITMREKGKTLDESGGLVLTSDMWMAPRIAAMREIGEFELRYMRKLQGSMMAGASAEDMATAMAMYPMMKDAIARMNTESVKLDGTAIQTTATFDAVKSAEQMAEEQKQGGEGESKPKASGGLGGMLGGIASRAAKKKAEGGDQPKSRVTVMTTTNEVLKVTTDVSAADVAIPAGFRENR